MKHFKLLTDIENVSIRLQESVDDRAEGNDVAETLSLLRSSHASIYSVLRNEVVSSRSTVIASAAVSLQELTELFVGHH